MADLPHAAIARGIDTVLDRSVVLGYSRLGLAWRRELPTWPADPPAHALQGQGKLDVKVGLGNNDKHQIWAACPLAGQDGQFHEMDSYQQPGGTVGLDRRTEKAVLPDTLKGSWTGEYGDGTGTMKWLLCLNCTPPPPRP